MFPLGLSYISAVLKTTNNAVDSLNLNHYSGSIKDLINDKLNKKTYDIVCTGGNALAYSTIEEITKTAKNHSTKPKVILGGPIISTMPKVVFEKLEIDYGVIGEGEQTIIELMEAFAKNLNFEKINGLIYRQQEQVVITQKRAPIENLDALPFPDYSGLDFEMQIANTHSSYLPWLTILDKPRVYPLLASRSCPFQCTFCYHDSIYRKRSLENIMSEIKLAVEKYDINYLLIYDECFSLDKERLKGFCRELKQLMIEKKKDIKWFVQTMVTVVDKDLLMMLKDSGCAVVSYGFESFSPPVLKSMGKPIKPEQIDFAFHETINQRMSVAATFIFGDIAETNETAQETLNWWANQAQGQVRLSFVMPYPRSKLYEYCLEKGLVKDELSFIKNHLSEYLNVTEKMSDKDIKKLAKKVSRYELKYLRYSVPSKHSIASDHTYSLSIKCPFCNESIDYKNLYSKGNKRIFQFEVFCRKCYRRFYIVSPLQKAIIRTSYYAPSIMLIIRALEKVKKFNFKSS
jgi:anaerobic magnesium-protoporphyrin IX monomethyl ester cyclase